MYAALHNRANILHILLSKKPPECTLFRQRWGADALGMAAAHGHLESVMLLAHSYLSLARDAAALCRRSLDSALYDATVNEHLPVIVYLTRQFLYTDRLFRTLLSEGATRVSPCTLSFLRLMNTVMDIRRRTAAQPLSLFNCARDIEQWYEAEESDLLSQAVEHEDLPEIIGLTSVFRHLVHQGSPAIKEKIKLSTHNALVQAIFRKKPLVALCLVSIFPYDPSTLFDIIAPLCTYDVVLQKILQMCANIIAFESYLQ